MKPLMFFIFVIAGCMMYNHTQAQVIDNTSIPTNNAWKKEHTKDRKPIAYSWLREADVMWSKRIWRKIDLREKMNHPLYYPETPVRDRVSLAQILWDAVQQGELTVYANEDFTIPKTPTEINAENTRVDTNTVTINGVDTTIISSESFRASDVKYYQITEQWFFDKQRSSIDVRILSICPLVEKFTINQQTGDRESKGFLPLFYIHFPSTRSLLQRSECFNRFNDAERKTFDDIFWKRLFSSFIIKEENVYDRFIGDYMKGMDALLEADDIKGKIRIFEHDLWEY